MHLVVFENNKPYVIDEFREGRFDDLELASDVAETKFFQSEDDSRSAPTLSVASLLPSGVLVALRPGRWAREGLAAGHDQSPLDGHRGP
jgi:hypothetical protein